MIIDQPVLRLYEADPARPPGKLDLRLPFSIQNGFVRNGDISFWSRGVSVRAKGIQAAFRLVKDSFALQVVSPRPISWLKPWIIRSAAGFGPKSRAGAIACLWTG